MHDHKLWSTFICGCVGVMSARGGGWLQSLAGIYHNNSKDPERNGAPACLWELGPSKELPPCLLWCADPLRLLGDPGSPQMVV